MILLKSSIESQYILILIHFCFHLTYVDCQSFWMVCLVFHSIDVIHSPACCQILIYYLAINLTSLLLLYIISGFCSFILVNAHWEKSLLYLQKLSLFLLLVGFLLCLVYFLHKNINVNWHLYYFGGINLQCFLSNIQCSLQCSEWWGVISNLHQDNSDIVQIFPQSRWSSPILLCCSVRISLYSLALFPTHDQPKAVSPLFTGNQGPRGK